VPAAAGQCSAPVTLAATATGTPAPTITYALASGPIAAAYTFPVGVTSVTATATNSAGTDKNTFTVTVTDTERPTIVAPAAVAVGTDAGQCTASSVALGTATAADNCSGVTVTNDAPATFAKGTTTVTWTATDASGNQATATQTVTVRDTERPVLAALPNLRVSAPAAACGAMVSFVPSASDNCPGTTVVASPAAGSTFALGTTTVTVTATDAAGNTATSSFTVTVTDVTPPTASTRNLSVALVNGTATITAAQLDNGSADACGPVTLALSKTSFTCANAGANTVTLTVTDAAGNVATAPATVTVTGGAVAPSISVAPASLFDGKQYKLYLGYGAQTATLTASGGVSYAWSPATDLSSSTSANPTFAPTKEGTYTFTVTARTSGGCTASSTVTIVVEDVRCGNNNDKVQVCHNGQAICVASSALNVHLSHGDQLGSCAASRGAAVLAVAPATSATTSALAVYPNPTAGAATLTGATPCASVTVLDAVGRVVLAATADATGTAALALPAELPSGVYVVRAGQQAVRLTVE
jgi:PKD repeat protein